MNTPTLSIVTVSFNQAEFLPYCLQSVVDQKSADVEFIVVDPGSTDGSRVIAQQYATGIDHMITEPDRGPADGLNNGFMVASGEWGFFLNADDFLLPGAMRLLLLAIERAGDADLLLGGGWMVDANLRPLRRLSADLPTARGLLGGTQVMIQQGMAFRMELFRRVGGFNGANRTCWDLELLLDFLINSARVGIIKERVGGFRLHAGGLSGGVGGAGHFSRYQKDLMRLRERCGVPTGSRRWSLARKLVQQPMAHTIAALVDRALPTLVRRAWERDQKRTASAAGRLSE